MIDATLLALEKTMDLRMKAHEIHASNIANANVPNYKAKKIEFEGRMKELINNLEDSEKSGDPLLLRENAAQTSIPRLTAEIFEDPLAPLNGSGNSVNPEKEQTELAKNMLGYETALSVINKKLAMQKYVVSEGGR